MRPTNGHLYEFDCFRLNPAEHVLLRDGQIVPLTPKVFEVLLLLVEKQGHVVDKEEVFQRVWADTFVEETNLTKSISVLRRILADNDSGGTFIETIPKRGYRFTAKVEEVTAESFEKAENRQNSELFLSRNSKTALLTIAVLLISMTAIGYWYYAGRQAVQIESIAVMPFVNESGNPESDYLSDGISEALINALTEVPQLRVIARTTAFRYKGREIDPRSVGRELNVGAVLIGRVRHIGDRLNVQVDLVDVASGAQLWGEAYERKVSDVLAVKQTIARQTVEKLRPRVSGEQQQQFVKHDTTSAEAYQFYLKGLFYSNKRNPDAGKKSIEFFRQALEYDPNYASAYVGLADCYQWLGSYAAVPLSEAMPKASAAVDRALQIDESLPEAHAILAEMYDKQWRWKEKEGELKRAISLNPNYAESYTMLGNHLFYFRQFHEALKELKRAQELDPLSAPISNMVAHGYLYKNDLDSAIEESKKTLELDPGSGLAHAILGGAYLKQGRREEAVVEFQNYVELSGRLSSALRDLGYCYAVSGRQSEALQIIKELEGRYAKGEAFGVHLAGVYGGLGDKDSAFAWLEKDFQQRSPVLQNITYLSNFDDLRNDPRYKDLVRRMGLSE